MNTIHRLTKIFPSLQPEDAALMSWGEAMTWVIRQREEEDINSLAQSFLEEKNKNK